MLDVITKIKQAEQEAENIKKQAQQQASATQAQAQKQGKQLLQDEKSAAAAKAEERIALAEQQAADFLSANRQRVEHACETLRSNAQNRLNEAAKLIVERIVGAG